MCIKISRFERSMVIHISRMLKTTGKHQLHHLMGFKKSDLSENFSLLNPLK